MSYAAKKIVTLGPFAVAAYCGSRWSAGFALRRLQSLFTAYPKPPASPALEDFIKRQVLKGGRASAHAKAPPGEGPEAFEVLIGYVDRENRLGLLGCEWGRPMKRSVKSYDSVPHLVTIGTGYLVANEIVEFAREWIRFNNHDIVSVEAMPVAQQAGFLAASVNHFS
jgi:hypothetical protein